MVIGFFHRRASFWLSLAFFGLCFPGLDPSFFGAVYSFFGGLGPVSPDTLFVVAPVHLFGVRLFCSVLRTSVTCV